MTEHGTSDTQIDLWIVEDNHDYREQLAMALDLDDSIRCVQALGSFDEARDLLRREDAPDILLMDLNLPGTHGMDGISELKASHPLLQTIVLTVSGQRKSVFNALRAGASGYLLKSDPLDSVVTHIHEVVEGGVALSSAVTPFVVDPIKAALNQPPADNLGINEREREILYLLADGKSRTEIGLTLFIATATVDYHLRNLYPKLGVNSTTGAVARAFRAGILK